MRPRWLAWAAFVLPVDHLARSRFNLFLVLIRYLFAYNERSATSFFWDANSDREEEYFFNSPPFS
jgi:hypothetical protein